MAKTQWPPRLFYFKEWYKKSSFTLLSLSSNLVDSYVKPKQNSRITKSYNLLSVRKINTYNLGEKLCKEVIQQTKPTVLWQPCLFLSASLGLKGLLRVALSYSALSTSSQTFSSRGGTKKKERKTSAGDGASWQKFPKGCQGESLYWNRRYEAICFVSPLATSLPAWKKRRENQCLRKSLSLSICTDQVNQVSVVLTSQS